MVNRSATADSTNIVSAQYFASSEMPVSTYSSCQMCETCYFACVTITTLIAPLSKSASSLISAHNDVCVHFSMVAESCTETQRHAARDKHSKFTNQNRGAPGH